MDQQHYEQLLQEIKQVQNEVGKVKHINARLGIYGIMIFYTFLATCGTCGDLSTKSDIKNLEQKIESIEQKVESVQQNVQYLKR